MFFLKKSVDDVMRDNIALLCIRPAYIKVVNIFTPTISCYALQAAAA